MTQNTVLTALAVIALYWLVEFYETALRDPRFLDGWILAAAMLAQFAFHICRYLPTRRLGKASAWLKAHVYAGYFTIGAMVIHSGFTLPDSVFEWGLWTVFVLVALSGVLGIYLSRTIPGIFRENAAEPISLEDFPLARAKLAHKLDALIVTSVKEGASPTIAKFYAARLRGFFSKAQYPLAHLRGSKRPLTILLAQFDDLEREAGGEWGKLLAEIRQLVAEKFALDRQWTLQGLLQVWLFVHVPATYCLFVLSLLHVALIYAYSTGVR